MATPGSRAFRLLGPLCLAALGCCGALVACASDDGKVGLKDAAPRLADAYCDALYACDCAALGAAPPFEDQGDCKAQVEEAFDDGLEVGDAAGLKFNEDYVATIEGLYGDVGCRTVEDLTRAMLYGDTTGIEVSMVDQIKMFSGKGSGDSREACETTALPYPINLFGRADSCDADSYCDASNKCRLIDEGGAEGSPCSSAADCELGLSCAPQNEVSQLVCADLPGPGGTCFGIANLCENSYCDLGNKTCTQLPVAGDPCAPDVQTTLVRCAEGAFCDAQDVCRVLPDVGESCTTACADGARCDSSGTCVEAVAAVCL